MRVGGCFNSFAWRKGLPYVTAEFCKILFPYCKEQKLSAVPKCLVFSKKEISKFPAKLLYWYQACLQFIFKRQFNNINLRNNKTAEILLKV